MALTDPNTVLRTAGLDHPTDFRRFRFSGEPELHAYVTDLILAAGSFLRRSIGATTYDQTSDAGLQAQIRLAETYEVCIHLVKTLEARRVYGSHLNVESEDSTGYAGLIEQWQGYIDRLVEEFSDPGLDRPIYIPAIALTAGVNRSEIPLWENQLQTDLDIANSLIGEDALS